MEKNSVLKVLSVVLVVALLSTVLVGCLGSSNSSSYVQTIKNRGRLIIGTSSGFNPFEVYNDTANTIEGFDIDIAKQIAQGLGVSLEIRDMGFEALIGAVKVGTIDLVIAGMSITPDRNLSVAFSDPYFKADQAIVVKKTTTNINNPADLNGKKIAVNLETTGDYWVTDNVHGATVSRFPFAYETFLALDSGIVDAVVIDKPVGDAYAAKDTAIKVVYTILTNEFYGIAIRQSNTDFIAFVNNVLATMQQDGSMQQLVIKWF
jgi:polar amino acid transport system substrate-binding protein